MTTPLADPALVDALAADLRSAGYTTAGVTDLLGEQAEAAMDRGVWWPAERATRDGGPLGVLVRLFLLGGTETHDDVARALPGSSVDALIANGVLEPGVSAALDIRPHSDGAADFLVVSDLDSATRPGPVRPDHVLGIGGASVSLARAVARNPVRRALDLGTGCGIQALHLDASRIAAIVNLPLVAQHVEVVDDGPFGLPEGGIAVALKGEFEDIHGDGSIRLLVEQQIGEEIGRASCRERVSSPV